MPLLAALASISPSSPDLLLAGVLGIVIGLFVGMVGGGGAVLAVPVLVYVIGLDVHVATTVSLAVVGAAASTGAITQLRRGTVCWTSAAWFAVAAIAGSVVGTALNALAPAGLLLLIFSAVMGLAARATWMRAGAAAAGDVACPRARAELLVPIGLGVGALTGLIGVGGGFVVVPVLAAGLSFGMRQAMGTSMVIVAIVSFAGLGAHLAAGSAFDGRVALAMGAATMVGASAGARLAPRIPTERLGRGFAVLVGAVALAVAGATVAGVGVV